ncbi:hypothetical protein IW262DRAFT_136261 [Armillaria fumosa]|nr:hypothetical protein IW262DRAFT_136261 [Armillaria fumosa]
MPAPIFVNFITFVSTAVGLTLFSRLVWGRLALKARQIWTPLLGHLDPVSSLPKPIRNHSRDFFDFVELTYNMIFSTGFLPAASALLPGSPQDRDYTAISYRHCFLSPCRPSCFE